MMNIACSTFLSHQPGNNAWNYKEKLKIIKVQQLCLSTGEEGLCLFEVR